LFPGPEDALGLTPRLLENLGCLSSLGDRPHRLDEGVEEGRLSDELALGNPVPAPLGEEQ